MPRSAGALRSHHRGQTDRRRANAGQVVGENRRSDVTASVGITSIAGGRELDTAKLLIESDIAMYQAKAAGKNGIAVYAREGSAALS